MRREERGWGEKGTHKYKYKVGFRKVQLARKRDCVGFARVDKKNTNEAASLAFVLLIAQLLLQCAASWQPHFCMRFSATTLLFGPGACATFFCFSGSPRSVLLSGRIRHKCWTSGHIHVVGAPERVTATPTFATRLAAFVQSATFCSP